MNEDIVEDCRFLLAFSSPSLLHNPFAFLLLNSRGLFLPLYCTVSKRLFESVGTF